MSKERVIYKIYMEDLADELSKGRLQRTIDGMWTDVSQLLF